MCKHSVWNFYGFHFRTITTSFSSIRLLSSKNNKMEWLCTQKNNHTTNNNNGDDNMHLSNPRIFRTECQLFMWITMSLCCVCMLSLVVLYWHTQIYTILILKSTNLKGIEFLLSSKTRWIHNRGSSSIFKTRPKAVLIYMAWHGMLCYAVWFTLLKSILMQCDDDGYMTRPWFSLFFARAILHRFISFFFMQNNEKRKMESEFVWEVKWNSNQPQQ